LNNRVSKLEKRGSVEVTLEKPVEVKPVPTNTYNGPRLYNNKTKIVFHDSKEFTCLAENIYYESRGEPYIGKIAVAHTTFNRAEKVGSFCDAVHAPSQFSWTLNTQEKPHGREWEASKHAAKMFANGVRVKNLEHTDHYHASYVDPYWNVNMKRTATIGTHQFYASK
jgi:spore germination cell wall hydrolase CwlJ-like protein